MSPPPSRFPLALALATALLPIPGRGRPSADESRYRQPPAAVAQLLVAPRVPRGGPSLSPDGRWLVAPELPALLPIATLAEPVDKLAGLEVLPALSCTRGQLKAAWSGFSIVNVATAKRVRAQLPDGARVGFLDWSSRGDRLACALYAPGGAELWVVEAATGAARKLEGVHLNTALTTGLEWTLDGRAILCAAVAGSAEAPEAPRVPTGPETRTGVGRAVPQRTARDVLRTAEDQKRLGRAVTVQLQRVPADGGVPQPLGEPAKVLGWSVSPDESFLTVEVLSESPLGYPYSLFPRQVEIWNIDGHREAGLEGSPLNDRSAISSVSRLGPRNAAWSPDGGALWFFSWQDSPGADPLAAVRDTSLPQPGTDRLMRLDAPFTGEPVVVTTTDQGFSRMQWTADGRKLLLWDSYQPRRRERLWWIDPAQPNPTHHLLVDRSQEGVYDAPGEPLSRRERHAWRLWSSPDSRALFFTGEGFRPDGQRPFLDRVDLATVRRTRLWQSEPQVLEQPYALLGADGRRFVTLLQSNREPPNWYARTIGKRQGSKLSNYADPTPALSSNRRLRFTFTRSDSVKLNAEAVLPAGWKPGERLPTIFWVYPNDYRSAAAASQNRRSPNRFPSQSPLNPEVLVTQGYAVVYPDIAIVGTNDRYVEEIERSARAAIEECVRQGFCDARRVGVGGHSYGAFSTVNLLAHTDLFQAGVASDGAYNRTLTPFTFQAEERTLWQARDTYLQMSPFLYADRIRAPLLLMHNLDDTNVGTHPMQSERLFEALNGLGKTVSLVEYPFEDHGPAARESVLDYWARAIEWYDRYVKNAGAPPAGGPVGNSSP